MRINVATHIAFRYLFSKKSTNVINVISGISVVGVMVATMAMVVVMSVFNGFSDLVATLFTSLDPQLKVVPVDGKTIAADDPRLVEIKKMDEVAVASECLESQALAIYGARQAMVKMKGVDDNYTQLNKVKDNLFGYGAFETHAGDLQFCIPGIRLAYDLGMAAKFNGYLKVFAPCRNGQLDLANPMDGFVVDSLLSAGVVFCVNQQRYDREYLFTSLQFARNLLGADGEISSLELKMKPGVSVSRMKGKIEKILNNVDVNDNDNENKCRLAVLDRYEQQEETFNIMKIEKMMAYVFLTFILVVACFNIVGSLSMLIIDKKKDTETLRALGARDSLIRFVFILEGWLISACGAVLGVALGLLLCLLQQEFGFVRLGKSEGAFIVDAYPVSVHYFDVLMVFITVLVVGFMAAAVVPPSVRPKSRQ